MLLDARNRDGGKSQRHPRNNARCCVVCVSLCRLVEVQPLFLVTECVEQALVEIQRLMPNANAAALLVSDPDWLLRVQRGQRWLGLHPDSQLGEQVDWKPPEGSS